MGATGGRHIGKTEGKGLELRARELKIHDRGELEEKRLMREKEKRQTRVKGQKAETKSREKEGNEQKERLRVEAEYREMQERL